MRKRLQILLDEAEYHEVRKLALAEKLTIAEWVRKARRRRAEGQMDRKLAAIRAAAAHDFPTGDIARIFAEIERGYLGEKER